MSSVLDRRWRITTCRYYRSNDQLSPKRFQCKWRAESVSSREGKIERTEEQTRQYTIGTSIKMMERMHWTQSERSEAYRILIIYSHCALLVFLIPIPILIIPTGGTARTVVWFENTTSCHWSFFRYEPSNTYYPWRINNEQMTTTTTFDYFQYDRRMPNMIILDITITTINQER